MNGFLPAAARCPTCGDALAPDVVRCPRDGSLVGDPTDPLVGATLAGRYIILSRLGRGGMASVFLARHLLLDRLAAVKILRADLCLESTHRERFVREAKAVTRIQHENIITVTDYGQTPEGVAFLVMEYVPGETLGAVLNRERLTLPRALEIARQIASGLARAHQQNVVHRDLKPDNVLLTPRPGGGDLVKVVDFGIAKVLDAPALTLNQRIFGTPGYIAPEYATGGAITPRTDLYGIGVVLYEMVTGLLPFSTDHPADMLLRSLVEDPVPPRAREPALPASLDALVTRCLARKPEGRPRDAYHFLEDLARVTAEVAAERPSLFPDLLAPRAATSIRPEHLHRAGTTDPPRAMVESAPSRPMDVVVLGLAPPPAGQSIDAARAWGAWLSAVRGRLQETLWGDGTQAVQAAVRALELRLGAMQDDVLRGHQHRLRMLSLEGRGRDFRASIGRAMDTLAADLSSRQRERDALAARRVDLDARHAVALTGAAGGDRTAVGEADTALWELAACGQMLADAVGTCEDLEFQLVALSAQIDRLNEALEADHGALLEALTRTLRDLAEADVALRRLSWDLERAIGSLVRPEH